jgi:hypothetical protein
MFGKRRIAVYVGVVVVVLIGVLVITQFVLASPNKQPEGLLGSWNIDVFLEEADVHFPGLLTFSADGSLFADEPAVNETTGHGNWLMGNRGQVKYTFVALNSDSTGQYTGRLKLIGTLQRDEGKETWSGPFRITIYDANDLEVLVNNGTFILTRIAVEELP